MRFFFKPGKKGIGFPAVTVVLVMTHILYRVVIDDVNSTLDLVSQQNTGTGGVYAHVRAFDGLHDVFLRDVFPQGMLDSMVGLASQQMPGREGCAHV